jgi:hypothetical protein
MVSTRYAAAAACLLAVALVPTVVHNYLGATVVDGRRAEAIPLRLAGYAGRPTARPERWARRNFDAADAVERYYGPGDRLRLFAARSYDAKKLYHHAELVASYGTSLVPDGRFVLPGSPAVPVSVLRSNRAEGGGDLVMYALISGDEVIGNPHVYQLRASLRQLLRGRELLTLVYVHDRGATPGTAIENEPAAQLLREAVAAFLAQPANDPS